MDVRGTRGAARRARRLPHGRCGRGIPDRAAWRRRRAACLRERMPSPRHDAPRGLRLGPQRDQVPVSRVDVRARRPARRVAERRRRRRDRPRSRLALADPPRGVGGLRLPEPGRPGPRARAGGRDPARLADRARAIRGGRPAGRRAPRVRRTGELEDRGRELPRVPALSDGAPRAREDRAALPERRGRGGGPAPGQLDGPRPHIVHRHRPVDAPDPSRARRGRRAHVLRGVPVPEPDPELPLRDGERRDDRAGRGRSNPGDQRVPLPPGNDRGRRVRPERGRRLPRPGGAPGLAGLRTRPARSLLAVLHGRHVPAAGEVDRGLQPPVPGRARPAAGRRSS